MRSNLINVTWWRHQMETFSALLAICAGNSPVPGEFPTQRPVTRSFDVYFDLRLNKRLSKQSWGWWLETLLCPLWRYSYDIWSKLTHILTIVGIFQALAEATDLQLRNSDLLFFTSNYQLLSMCIFKNTNCPKQSYKKPMPAFPPGFE